MATLVAVRRKFRLRLLALLCLLLQQVGEEEERFRSVRRCERNAGWWEMVWSTYDNTIQENLSCDTPNVLLYTREYQAGYHKGLAD